jgi:hypothetical protein
MRFAPRLHKESVLSYELAQVLCGGGVKYLYRSPASRRRRRKWNPSVWWYYRATLFLGVMNMGGSGPPGWGSPNSETVKCDHESRGTRIWEWLLGRGPAAVVSNRHILSWERMFQKDCDRKCSVEKCYWSWVSRETASRKVTLTVPQVGSW